MSLLVKALLVASLAVGAIPVANALAIVIDDRTELPSVSIDGQIIGFGETTTVQALGVGIAGVFTGVNVQFLVLDPGTANLSDIIDLFVGPSDTLGHTRFDFRFFSDGETPFAYPAPPPAGGPIQEFITETGNFQTIYSSSDLSTQGNPDFVISFASDVEGTVPEPATLALLSLGLAGLGFSRRKQ